MSFASTTTTTLMMDSTSTANNSKPMSIKVIVYCNLQSTPLEFTFAHEKLTWDSLTVLLQSSVTACDQPICLYYKTVAQPELVCSLENQGQLSELLSSLLATLPATSFASNSYKNTVTLRLYMDKEHVITPVFVSSAAAFIRLGNLVDQHQQVIQLSRRIVRFVGMLASYIAVNGCSGNQSFEPEFGALEKMIQRKEMKLQQQSSTVQDGGNNTQQQQQPDTVVLSADEDEDFQDSRGLSETGGCSDEEGPSDFARPPFPPHPHFMDPRMAAPHPPHSLHHYGHFPGFGSFDRRRMFFGHPGWRQEEGNEEPLFQGLGDFFWRGNHHHRPPHCRGPLGGGTMGHPFFGSFFDRKHPHPPYPPFGPPPRTGNTGFGEWHGMDRGHDFGGMMARGGHQHPGGHFFGFPRVNGPHGFGGGHYAHFGRHGFGGKSRRHHKSHHHHHHHHHRGSISSTASSESTSSSGETDKDVRRKKTARRHCHYPQPHFDKSCLYTQQQQQEQEKCQADELSKEFCRLQCGETSSSSSPDFGLTEQQQQQGTVEGDVYVLSRREFKRLMRGSKGRKHSHGRRHGSFRKHWA